jgi:1-deoxy-D-xylulose-5-phosphate reductoisomerase
MEISISSVLFDDNSVDLNKFHLDLKTIKTLNFYEIDDQKFNSINLAKKSINYGGLAPSVLNYTNELMVDLFLQKKILFTDIVINNEKFLNQFITEGNNKIDLNIDNIKQSFAIVDGYLN